MSTSTVNDALWPGWHQREETLYDAEWLYGNLQFSIKWPVSAGKPAAAGLVTLLGSYISKTQLATLTGVTRRHRLAGERLSSWT